MLNVKLKSSLSYCHPGGYDEEGWYKESWRVSVSVFVSKPYNKIKQAKTAWQNFARKNNIKNWKFSVYRDEEAKKIHSSWFKELDQDLEYISNFKKS
jgi:hypothetical protein